MSTKTFPLQPDELDQTINLKIRPSVDEFILKFDGCSKGNPGRAGCGIVIYKNNEEIFSRSKFLGEKLTNNQAEYNGLILGLSTCIEHNIKNLKVQGDSLLVISQMKGVYKVNSPLLLTLYNKAKYLASKFDYIEFSHIFRNNNKHADKLANLSLNTPQFYSDSDSDTSSDITTSDNISYNSHDNTSHTSSTSSDTL